jgi:hypothetical protein
MDLRQERKKMRCAIFSCKGLGDGLISLVLCNNLALNKHSVTLFHPFLSELKEWIPSCTIQPFPRNEEIERFLKVFDRFYIFNEKSPWMQAVIDHCRRIFPDKTLIINPIATKNTDYPFWENAKFDGSRPFVDNLEAFCRGILKLNNVTKSNGIRPAQTLEHKRYAKRVVIHPSSSREGKNWPRQKYVKLCEKLKGAGFDPKVILHGCERDLWADHWIDCPEFSSLEELAAYIFESGAMVGNDSGIGHLASCLGLPTVTVCRSKMASLFWRPSWSRGIVICPSSLIPNIKGLRWRDKYWKKFISVSQVYRSLNKIV